MKLVIKEGKQLIETAARLHTAFPCRCLQNNKSAGERNNAGIHNQAAGTGPRKGDLCSKKTTSAESRFINNTAGDSGGDMTDGLLCPCPFVSNAECVHASACAPATNVSLLPLNRSRPHPRPRDPEKSAACASDWSLPVRRCTPGRGAIRCPLGTLIHEPIPFVWTPALTRRMMGEVKCMRANFGQ